MDGCLLCLELNKAVCMTVNSSQWQELKIKNIIEQHLWPMKSIQITSWVCSTCWQELNDFHKFYIRIEEAHVDFGLIVKKEVCINLPEAKEDISSLASDDEFQREDIETKNLFDINNLNACHLEPEISMHEPPPPELVLTEEEKPVIKEEEQENEFVEEDELEMDDKPLIQRRKRGRRPKNSTNENDDITKDPLTKTKKPKVVKIVKTKKLKTRKTKETSNKEKSLELTTTNKESVDNSEIKDVNETLATSQEPNVSLELQNNNDNANNDNNDNADIDNLPDNDEGHDDGRDNDYSNDSDSNYEPDKEEPTEVNVKKKKKYVPATNMKRHEKDKFIAENFKISCIVCQIPMETFQIMRKHCQDVHKVPGYVICCGKKFYRRCILLEHLQRHLDPNDFKCKECDKVMVDRRGLELHLKQHVGKKEKNHICDICGKGFGNRTVLKTHKLTHLSESEKRFPCSDCGKNFGSNYLLSNHYRSVHLNKYAKICDICGKSIRSKEVFERHMLEHDGKQAPTVSCDICGKLLTDKTALKRHKGIVHPVDGKQEHICPICSKISPNLKAHKMHIHYKHKLGYDHKCTICDKAFKTIQSLTEHMASHTGTVLYTCPWCPKTFNSSSNMHNHRKKGHPKEWEEATRKRYSGNLPPNYHPPPSLNNVNSVNNVNTVNTVNNYPIPMQ